MLHLPSVNNYSCIVASSHGGSGQQKIPRPLATFPEKISADPFISFNLDKKVCDAYRTEIQKLKEEVRPRIVDRKTKAAEKLNLIDNVERLGIYYHFEEEIEEQLSLIHSENGPIEFSDLSTAALGFRLFRQHGLTISSDIFDEFTYGNGKFKQSLRNDTKGLLNLFEAAYLRTHKDGILDEALLFTRNHLYDHISSSSGSGSGSGCCPFIDRQVKHALKQSIHRGLPPYEARLFISAYEQDNFKDISLLRLAKVEFNLSQLLYRQELSTTLRWWKELDLPSRIPYGRDRLIECYFLCMGLFFEPQCSITRIMVAKFYAFGAILDDTYDAYGTVEELKLFTDAIQRWDMSAVDGLPEYMKVMYTALLAVYDEFDQYAVQEGRPYAFHYIKEAIKEYSRNSMIQSNWLLNKNSALPAFGEYLSNALRIIGVKIASAASFLFMECSESEYEWLFQHHPLLVAAETICRLHNDVATHQLEKERDSATPIDLYMKSYNVSEEEAKKDIMKMVEDGWKDINAECYRLQQNMKITSGRSSSSRNSNNVMVSILNQARLMDFIYKNDTDNWTNPNSVKPAYCSSVFINQMLLQPLPL